jgi:hypothetical protein
MQRWLVLALPLVAACTDWGALYVNDAPDASPEVPGLVDAAGAPDVLPIVLADGPGSEVVVDCPATGPLALWRFEGHGAPNAADFIPDQACRAPDVPLAWDLERNAGTTELMPGSVHLDGGFLFAAKPASDDLGLLLTRSRSFSLELWLRAMHGESGTIFATNGAKDSGRAFSIAQKDGLLHFAVRTTATDPNGEHFLKAPPNGPSAELVVALPVDTFAPVHVVAMYSGLERVARIYVDGVAMETLPHARPDVPAPVPVWSPGKNQLGLGGSFDGTGWHGWLHLVAVYDTALSATEVQQLFVQGPRR